MKIILLLLIVPLLLSPLGKSMPQGHIEKKLHSEKEKNTIDFLHPYFDFTKDTISERLVDLPEKAQSNYYLFLELSSRMAKMPSHYLRLVDKSHALSPDESPEDLVKIIPMPGINILRKDMFIDRQAGKALARMGGDAHARGIVIGVSSAYRSYEYQTDLFRYYAENFGESEANRFSALPGESQHQLGTTIDFGDISNNFANSAQGRWVSSHAENYGWSLSYPEGAEDQTGYIHESWHWRWIGPDAIRMQNEFFMGYQYMLLEFWHLNIQEILNSLGYQIDVPENR